MADSSRSSSSFNGGSPISNIARDHLFTVLFLLPVESVLAFAMTCKRFRAMASSDSLWESLSRRDWGSNLSFFQNQNRSQNRSQNRIPWMRLYKQVREVDSVSCHKLLCYELGLPVPDPRASHSLNFVSDCLVLFGGGCEGGRHLADTWVTNVGNDGQRVSKWQKVSSGVPSGRFGHTCVVVNDSLILFGGIDDHGSRLNDTWLGQLTRHDTLGFTFSWNLLEAGPAGPPPRGAHAACRVGERKMVVHGGIGQNGVRLSDTWLLELSENLRYGTWIEFASNESPPARSGHTLTCLGESRVVLFGGRGLGYEVLSDIWVLEFDRDHLNWVQILYDLRNIPEGSSLPRVGHSATRILGGRVLIYGGEDSSRHRKDDFWVLDLSSVRAKVATKPKIWRGMRVKAYKPKCRSFHRACVDESGHRIYVFGGMVDGLLEPAEPFGLKFDGELFQVELVLQI